MHYDSQKSLTKLVVYFVGKGARTFYSYAKLDKVSRQTGIDGLLQLVKKIKDPYTTAIIYDNQKIEFGDNYNPEIHKFIAKKQIY